MTPQTFDVELRSIDEIRPYDRNPRQNDQAVDAVAASLQEFGWRQPIVIDADGVIIAGHTRWKAARKLGLAKVPVHVATDLTPEQVRAYRISDNRTNELAEWDMEILPIELAELREGGFDMDLLAFDEEELGRLLNKGATVQEGLTDPDAVPEPPEEPVTRRGDLWLLGEHRLLCGDSTSAEDVRRLMNGEKAILFATDPPYLVGYNGTNHPHKWNEEDKNKDWSDSYGVTWDEAKGNEELYDKFVATAVAEAILPNAAWYCWHASRRQAMVEAVWEKHGAFVHQQIVWMKDRPILTRSWYMWRHEPCFMGWVRPNKPPRTAEDYPHSVWELATVKCGESTEHPTSKPVEVFAIPMRQHTKPGDVCYEPFSGSGSQLIAAEQLNRRCFAMEIEPRYVEVAVRRWEEFSGKKAERIAAGEESPVAEEVAA